MANRGLRIGFPISYQLVASFGNYNLSGQPVILIYVGGSDSVINVSWTASGDGTVVGYKVYWGTTSGNYTNSGDAGNSTNYQITGLTPGNTYFIAVTSYDAQGGESPYTTEISRVA